MSRYIVVFFCALCALIHCTLFFFLRIRRPPRSTLDRSSAASDVYKRQIRLLERDRLAFLLLPLRLENRNQLAIRLTRRRVRAQDQGQHRRAAGGCGGLLSPVSYTHLTLPPRALG